MGEGAIEILYNQSSINLRKSIHTLPLPNRFVPYSEKDSKSGKEYFSIVLFEIMLEKRNILQPIISQIDYYSMAIFLPFWDNNVSSF